MNRCLYFDWFSSATEFLRLTPLDYISHPDLQITRSTEHNITFATLSQFDTIIIERPSSEASLNLIRLARDMGKKVIIDVDDDYLHLPNDIHPMYYTYESEKASSIKCISLANEVWVSTPAIKQSFRLYNKNIHVIPNCHNDVIYPVQQKRPFKFNKIAMYRGGHSHLNDMYEPGVTEWLLKLINGNKKWAFYFIGQRFEWLEKRVKHGNYYRHDGASTIQFYKLLHDYNPCTAFYPLTDNLFNRSKSSICWQEMTYAGACFFGNKKLPEFNKDGILPLSDMLIKDPEVLEFYNRVSWEEITDTLLVTNINKLRTERLLCQTA